MSYLELFINVLFGGVVESRFDLSQFNGDDLSPRSGGMIVAVGFNPRYAGRGPRVASATA